MLLYFKQRIIVPKTYQNNSLESFQIRLRFGRIYLIKTVLGESHGLLTSAGGHRIHITRTGQGLRMRNWGAPISSPPRTRLLRGISSAWQMDRPFSPPRSMRSRRRFWTIFGKVLVNSISSRIRRFRHFTLTFLVTEQ